MDQTLLSIGILILWFATSRYLLPRLGVST